MQLSSRRCFAVNHGAHKAHERGFDDVGSPKRYQEAVWRTQRPSKVNVDLCTLHNMGKQLDMRPKDPLLESYITNLTLSDVGRGGQKGKKWECFQKFSSWKVHFPRGLMDKALDFDTKGP